MTHSHAPAGMQAAVQAALQLIPVLNAEQELARAAVPLMDSLREAGYPELAEKIEGAAVQLRHCLLESGGLVNTALTGMVAEAQAPAPEA